MLVMKTFSAVLESAGDLTQDEQESLLSILQHRLAEQKRAELVRTVAEARREYKTKPCRPASVAAIMKRIRA
jgi:chorismate mutase